MKMLFVSQEPRYRKVVMELRRENQVDYVFRSTKFGIDGRDFHIPKLFGFYRGFVLSAYLVVNLLLLKNRYDVCVTDYKSTYFTTIFPLLRKYCRIFRTNFIYDIRTIPVDHQDEVDEVVQKKFYRKLKYAVTFYQGISVITEEMRKYLQSKGIRFQNTVGVWESGVDVNKFRPLPADLKLKQSLGFQADDFICFYHGSLAYKRGVVELVESFQALQQSEPAIKLVILGDGESIDIMRQTIKKHRMENTVKIHERVQVDEVPAFISIADLCVVPLADIDWWRVSSPLKLMEYIACGKNILLTDIVAHTSVVGRDSSCFWFHEVTPETLAKAIGEIYRQYRADPKRYHDNGKKQREQLIGQISWEKRAQTFSAFLETVVGSHSERGAGVRQERP